MPATAQRASLRASVKTAGTARLAVDPEAGIIRGAAVMTIGPAEGHGFNIDRVTLEQVRSLIAAQPDGVPVRFTHQAAEAPEKLGTICGMLGNPRIDGDVLRADIHVGTYAASMPNRGDVRSYILSLAAEAPTKIGLSAVFYFQVDPTTNAARISRVESVDFVESPAANRSGLLAAKGNTMDPTIRKMLVDLGMPETATDAEAMEFLKSKLGGNAPASDGTAQMSALAAERQRIADVVSMATFNPANATNPLGGAAALSGEEITRLVSSGASREDARQAVLSRLAQTHGPYTVGVRDVSVRVGESRHLAQLSVGAAHALAVRGGVRLTQLASRASEFGGMPPTEIARRMLEHMGIDTRGMSRATLATALINPERALGNQFGRYAQLAHSTGDFSNVLSTSVNAALRSGYDENPPTWSQWAKRGMAPDFRDLERPILSNVPTPTEVGELEEYDNVNLTDAKETFRVKKYGQIVSLSLEALINDRLGAFMGLTKKHGQACNRLEDDLAYAQLTSNPTLDADSTALFHADHANLTASGTVISVTSLGVARAAMARQTGMADEILNIRPYALIVPVTQQTLAEQVVASLVDPSKSNDTANPAFIRNLIVVGDARLDEVSTLSWYMAASPSSGDTVEVAFLEDEPAPVVEEREGFRVDGTEYKVRHTVAARALDYRGLYKNNGA